jgi:hypothetical protein
VSGMRSRARSIWTAASAYRQPRPECWERSPLWTGGETPPRLRSPADAACSAWGCRWRHRPGATWSPRSRPAARVWKRWTGARRRTATSPHPN